VPKIYNYSFDLIKYNNKEYLYGIKMDKINIIEPYRALMHMPLGYKQYNLDTIWTKDYRNPISIDNPPRGYYPHNNITLIWLMEPINVKVCIRNNVALVRKSRRNILTKSAF
jgi:hypothetical protein